MAGGARGETASLQIESSQGTGDISGEIHASVAHPFATTAAALKDPSHWCEILMLHLNTKDCRISHEGGRTVVNMGVVSKYDQPASSAYRVTFSYRPIEDTAGALQVALDAEDGPLDTRNYRIRLRAAPGEGGRTTIRMSYSYSYGMVSRVAMQAYLATFGRNKVGFTVVGNEPDGKPRYIGGMRGVVERNTMRYYLAVQAYLDALSAPQGERMEASLANWFFAIERYPRQLHEMELADYLAMKRRELRETSARAGS